MCVVSESEYVSEYVPVPLVVSFSVSRHVPVSVDESASAFVSLSESLAGVVYECVSV